jgi:hypothetical protein
VDFEPTQKLMLDRFLKNNQVNVYIDDLDRGWEGRRDDVKRISALLNAVRDMGNENPGLRFKIGLPPDVYYLVRTSDESTDKIENAVVWQSWTNHEILVLLIKRIETFLGRGVYEPTLLSTRQRQLARYLNPIRESTFTGVGLWAKCADIPRLNVPDPETPSRPWQTLYLDCPECSPDTELADADRKFPSDLRRVLAGANSRCDQ